jgi:hypothetical protein
VRRAATGLSVLTICGLLLGACGHAPPHLNPPGPAPAVTPPVLAPAPRTIFIRPPAPPPAMKASCVPRGFPRPPHYPDTDAALRDAGGAADRYQLMAAGRILRTLRLAELEKILEGCR